MSTQVFILPVPPSVNSMFVNVPGKGRIKSKDYKKWISEAGWLLKAARVRPVTGRVEIALVIAEPKRETSDLDNRTKACLDLLVEHGIIEDDSSKYVRKITQSWGSKDLGGMSVSIRGLDVKPEDAHDQAESADLREDGRLVLAVRNKD